eukprot:scaffold1744_cov340-Prasinococcus_capsulatus_cf.AAC.22
MHAATSLAGMACGWKDARAARRGACASPRPRGCSKQASKARRSASLRGRRRGWVVWAARPSPLLRCAAQTARPLALLSEPGASEGPGRCRGPSRPRGPREDPPPLARGLFPLAVGKRASCPLPGLAPSHPSPGAPTTKPLASMMRTRIRPGKFPRLHRRIEYLFAHRRAGTSAPQAGAGCPTLPPLAAPEQAERCARDLAVGVSL